MKRREVDGGGSGEALHKGHRKNNWTTRKRNEQRLGGKGLSLQSFINAKSNHSGYNPAIIKKQREFYKNAKFVSKYRKSQKQQSQPKDPAPLASGIRDEDNIERKTKGGNKKIKKASLENTRQVYEKKHAEEEKAKMELEAIMQAKKEARAEAEAKRKALKDNMFKKTRFGQPVMKYRIEHLLEGLLDTPSKN